jgi:hypothetical protein
MRRWLVVSLALTALTTIYIGSLRLPAFGGHPPPANPAARYGYELWSATSNPRFVWFQSDGVYSVLTEPLYYRVDLTHEEFNVPAGFVTDYASVPQVLQWVVPKLGAHSMPAVVHDYLYWDQTCTREEADKILYATMEEYGSYLPTRLLVYLAVRVGARWAWDESAAEKAKGLPRFVPPPDPYEATARITDRDCRQDHPSWVPENLTWLAYRKYLASQGRTIPPVAPLEPAVCKLPEMTLFERYYRRLLEMRSREPKRIKVSARSP